MQATDASNASCTGLYDLLDGGWNAAVLDALRIPESALPSIVDSSGVLGPLGDGRRRAAAPLAAIVGDQQAAMMGQLRLAPGEVKITYGTAAMLDLNAGHEPLFSMHGAYPLVLWQRDGVRTYCLEGTAITAGAAVSGCATASASSPTPRSPAPSPRRCRTAAACGRIPAFQGLGTPYLDAGARAVIGGLSRASDARARGARGARGHRLALSRGVRRAAAPTRPIRRRQSLRADGGAARNDVLLQAQADALGLPVERPEVLDAAALGAAYLAGLATGVWRDHRRPASRVAARARLRAAPRRRRARGTARALARVTWPPRARRRTT